MNSINLTGRLTADVELKNTQSGIPVCSFRLAVKRPNAKDETDFINCKAWRSTAEFVAKYFSKGNMIAVTGYLTSNRYEDKNGNKRTDYEVICDRCEFCEGKTAQDQQPQAKETESEPEPNWVEVGDGDDLPF
jgi:single-strand DNA-binding protein